MELKEDLRKLNVYYDSLPEETKKRGLITFASYPLGETSFLTTRLWDKHMSIDWRENRHTPKPQKDNDSANKIMEEMRRFEKEGKPISGIGSMLDDQAHHMVIERMVLSKKSKWIRFPPEVMNRRKNKNGEWEDIPPQEQ